MRDFDDILLHRIIYLRQCSRNRWTQKVIYFQSRIFRGHFNFYVLFIVSGRLLYVVKTAFSRVHAEINLAIFALSFGENYKQRSRNTGKNVSKVSNYTGSERRKWTWVFGYALPVIFRDKKSYYYAINNKGFTRLNYISKVSSRRTGAYELRFETCGWQ